MAGRHVGRGPLAGPVLEMASLREDYLNQVQRDFLSRHCLTAMPTPLAKWPGQSPGPVAIIHVDGGAIGAATTKQPASGGLLMTRAEAAALRV